MIKKILVIIPTYNEIENIKEIIDKVIGLNIPNLSILVVDDNSPDGTGKLVSEIAKNDHRVMLKERKGKLGLGTAYVEGFKLALAGGYDYVFEMDADHSHNPEEIPHMLEKVKSFDLVIGSRYQTGVNVINWPFSRLVMSLFANWYTRFITGLPIQDCTSGFKCFRIKVLQSIKLDEISSDGYTFQIEMTYKAWVRGFKITEHPIIFYDRKKGVSKMSIKVMHEAVWIVWRLRIWTILYKVKKWLK